MTPSAVTWLKRTCTSPAGRNPPSSHPISICRQLTGADLLKHVIRVLWEAGILDRQIQLLTAQGTHRRMTEGELHQKLGEFHGRFMLHQHDWLDNANLRGFGHTSDGTCVTANAVRWPGCTYGFSACWRGRPPGRLRSSRDSPRSD